MTIKSKKVNWGWLTVLLGLLAICAAGMFSTLDMRTFDMANDHLWANVAWMITATIFVLMMTPGLSFFYGGIIGTLLTGIFAYDFFAAGDPEMPSRWQFFLNHVLVMAGVFIYTFAMSYALYWLTNKIIPMRVSKENEKMGLDASQHNEEYEAPEPKDAYPSVAEWFRGIEEN